MVASHTDRQGIDPERIHEGQQSPVVALPEDFAPPSLVENEWLLWASGSKHLGIHLCRRENAAPDRNLTGSAVYLQVACL